MNMLKHLGVWIANLFCEMGLHNNWVYPLLCVTIMSLVANCVWIVNLCCILHGQSMILNQCLSILVWNKKGENIVFYFSWDFLWINQDMLCKLCLINKDACLDLRLSIFFHSWVKNWSIFMRNVIFKSKGNILSSLTRKKKR